MLAKKNFTFLIHAPQGGLIIAPVLFDEERFLEAIFQRTERELAGPGRPGTVDSPVVGGALGGAAPSLGRARCLAVRGGYVNPASKGARWCPGASHRSIPSRRSREGNSKPRTHGAARMRKCGCLNLRNVKLSQTLQHTLRQTRARPAYPSIFARVL